MRIVIACNPFKGSLSSVKAGSAIARGFKAAIRGAVTDEAPIADGGDGTLDCIAAGAPCRRLKKKVPGPLGNIITADYLIMEGGETAVVEMARASGLALLALRERNPMKATALGMGLLIRDALDRGCRKVIIGIGGSATNEGGIGPAVAMGYRFLDSKGRELPPVAASLERLSAIDASGLRPGLDEIDFTVACDVTNPLLGPRGASAVYSPQKGATPAMAERLDKCLERLADIAKRDLGKDFRNVPGAGAAGGSGFGLMTFLGAKLVSGIDMMIGVAGLEERIAGANLLVTGEGRMDSQSVQGKAPFGLLRVAKRHGVPAIAFCGSVEGEKELYKAGFTAVFPIVTGPMKLDDAMARAGELLQLAATRAARLIAMNASGK